VLWNSSLKDKSSRFSPDGSKYPFISFSNEIKDIADSGSEADEKPNASAPKTKKLQSVATMQF
jgi:isocitrate lyase